MDHNDIMLVSSTAYLVNDPANRGPRLARDGHLHALGLEEAIAGHGTSGKQIYDTQLGKTRRETMK
jgi:hypothetical protein